MIINCFDSSRFNLYQEQWRTEHKCRRSDDLKCRPLRKKNSPPENMPTICRTQKCLVKMLRLPNCRPSAASFWPVPRLIFSSFLRVYQKCHLFNVNLTILHVNFNIFLEVPPLRKCRLGATRPFCSPRYATASGCLSVCLSRSLFRAHTHTHTKARSNSVWWLSCRFMHECVYPLG